MLVRVSSLAYHNIPCLEIFYLLWYLWYLFIMNSLINYLFTATIFCLFPIYITFYLYLHRIYIFIVTWFYLAFGCFIFASVVVTDNCFSLLEEPTTDSTCSTCITLSQPFLFSTVRRR